MSNALNVAGNASSAYGQIVAGRAAANADIFNANVEAKNAEISTQKAAWAGEEGDQAAGISQLKTAAKVGSIKANQGASGVEVGTGSNADVVNSAREVGALDALTIRSNAAREAYGYQTEAYSHRAQEALNRYAAKNEVAASKINAATTLLGGTAQSRQYDTHLSSNSIFSGS